ncbi:hypothetical protein OS493_014632 [Desmophyllum pertusum]|uniref:Uncharacterized protein n=1 Tax=Desmophyllum pertusum TaxID=174260 RepID=A0A9W9YPU3_9CNID|nr:hypothetical protein OS493_014632 [Desmophyllum pertusum]
MIQQLRRNQELITKAITQVTANLKVLKLIMLMMPHASKKIMVTMIVTEEYEGNIEDFLTDVEAFPIVETILETDSSESELEDSTSGSDSEDSDDERMLGSDIPDISASLLSGEQHDLHEIIADSPPLHSSSSCTLFEALVHLLDWFSSHPSISKEAFSKNLQLWHSILPEGNSLPTSYRAAYK